MTDCLFCKIIAGQLPTDTIFENDHVLAFRDINPQAPAHFLVVPKKHIATVNDLQSTDSEIIGQLYLAAKDIAAQLGVSENGYRCVINCNAGAGQTVFHIHLHVLAGRPLSWPPG